MDQNSEVNSLMESLNFLIQRKDETEVPAPNQMQRLEAFLQIMEGKLGENGRMLNEALSGIRQLTDVVVCQGQLLTKMHDRQGACARDLDQIATELRQARAESLSQLQLIARAQTLTAAHFQVARPATSRVTTPTGPASSEVLRSSGNLASQRSMYSPVSTQISPVPSQAIEHSPINQAALNAAAYGSAAPHSAELAVTDTRMTHNAVQKLPYALLAAPAPAPAAMLTTVTPEHSPNNITSVKIEAAEEAPAPAQGIAVASLAQQACSASSVHMHIEEVVEPAIPAATPAGPAAPATSSTPAAPTAPAVVPALARTPIKSATAPAAATPIVPKPSSAAKPSMMPVSLIKPVSPPLAAKLPAKTPGKLSVAAKSATTSASAVVAKPPHKIIPNDANAAARAAIPTVQAARPSAVSTSKRPEPSKPLSIANGGSKPTVPTMARRFANTPGASVPAAKQGVQTLSSMSSSSSMSISTSESGAMTQIGGNERETGSGWTDSTNDIRLVIKGQTRPRRDDEPATERPIKYRAASPRVGSAVMFSSENESNGSGSDIDELIEQRIVRSSSPELGDTNKVAVLDIVGASASRQSAQPNADISSRLGTRMPVYDQDLGDDAFGNRFGRMRHAQLPASQFLDGYGDNAQQGFGAHQEAWRAITPLLRDCLGVEITSTRLSTLIRPFFCISLTIISDVYRLIFGCRPMSSGVKLNDFNRALTKLDGFQFWSMRTTPSSLNETGISNFVLRTGSDFKSMCQRMLCRLMPPGGPKSPVVLGPLLCYYLLSMACMPLGQMSGPVLDGVFFRITDLKMTSLRVVTENGIRRMTTNELSEMTKNWARDLCHYMARDSRMQESLDVATRCYNLYMTNCRRKGGVYPNLDLDGSTAKEMLDSNSEHCRMFLGIRATELANLYKYLVCIMDGEVGASASNYLRQVSESLQNLSG
ncbi:hypothetical protein GGI20_001314 [Coemansia sp. BCRC 34301]|nr:hypothetical protein GGI20_001314 [Coemansia sp. BCRC 34301]